MPTQGPRDARRFTLHRGQSAVWRSPARFRVAVAGRRWGKSELGKTALVIPALRGLPGRYWYVAPDRIMAKDIMWRPLKEALDPSWLASPPLETELSVMLRNGAELKLLGAEDPDRLRGRGLRRLVVDEFADMDARAWYEVLRPQLSDYQAPAIFLGTPKSFNHLYDVFQLGQGGNPEWASWQFRTLDNPYILPSEIESARQTLDERTFRQEYEASFEALSGRVYYAFDRLSHVQSVGLDASLPACIALDFNIEPASAVIGQYNGRDVRVWREVQTRHAGGEATRATVQRAKDLLSNAGWTGEIRIYGDATGKAGKTTGPSDHAVVRDVFGAATWCIPHRNPHVRDRIAAVNGRCRTMTGERHLTIDPTCVKLIADLEQVIYADNGELDKASNPMLTHLSDALGYWLAREYPAIQATPAGSARVEWLL